MESEPRGPLRPRDYEMFNRLSDEELAAQCDFSAFRAHGPGGQGVNTTDSAVRLTHRPTGIIVTSREERSQLRNRLTALRKLREELKRKSFVPRKRKATKPTHSSQRRRLDSKKRDSQKKSSRRKVDRGDW